jgi:hypothetical protein
MAVLSIRGIEREGNVSHQDPPKHPLESPESGPNKGPFRAVPFSDDQIVRMRIDGVSGLRESELKRFIREVRALKGNTSNWFGAAWGLAGIAVTVALAAATDRSLALGAIAALFALGCLGCSIAHRDLNSKGANAAEKLAKEMEEAAGLDQPPTNGSEANGKDEAR